MIKEDAGDALSRSAGAVVQRFNERVIAGLRAAPPTKEWVRRAVRRSGAPSCPVRLFRLSFEIMIRYQDALADLFVAYPDDLVRPQPYDLFVGYNPPGRPDPIDTVRVLTEHAEWVDEWSVGWEHLPGSTGASPVSFPIREWSDLENYIERIMPDPDAPGRLDMALPWVRSLGPTKYIAAASHQTLWDRLNELRGMENALEDLLLSPREVERLLDALMEYQLVLVRRWAGLGNVDAVFLTDDFGSQQSLMMSPSIWRHLFAPRYRRICDEAHRLDMDVIFHSCGNISEIIGDMIDIGIDVIDPLQSEAIDLEWLAREFGGKVAFAGGLPDQLLPTLTPQGVRDEVRRAIDRLGTPFGNSYIIAPSNRLLADVPLANLEALFEACHDQ